MTDDDLIAGRYRTLRLLGTGGMARVFLARDERLGREVAVKRLHAHSPEDIARRFEREARLGASLNHPNLVAVYDVETDGESVLIVMEYVRGTTLASELRRGALGERRAGEVVADVAAALDAVHGAGIVHRDVKPANVLLREDGVAKLADLGIAGVAEGTELTASGSVLGTASYMAPEQVDGGRLGPEADIYALAAVAFEVVSGERAHRGDTPMAIARSITAGPPPDVRDVWPAASPALARALMRGMATRPGDRHLRAGELAAEVRAGLAATAEEAPTEVAPATTAAAPPPAPGGGVDSRVYGTSIHTTPSGRGSRRAVPLALALLAVAAVGVAIALLASGGAGGGDDTTAARQAPRTETVDRTVTTPAQTVTTPTPQTTTTPPAGGGGQTGKQLNDRGYALVQQGNAQAALPILQDAVAAYPQDSKELDYAFALFNYAQALRRSGRPGEAIPLLEKRLAISDNQRPAVEKELKAARKEAGG